MAQTIARGQEENDSKICIFCSTPTGFKDNGKAYCIDCYCKLRETAHTHDGLGKLVPAALPITPQILPSPEKGCGGSEEAISPQPYRIICSSTTGTVTSTTPVIC